MQNSISTKHNPDLDLSNKNADSAPFQLSLITASHGNATKRIVADDNGQPIKDTRHSLGIYAGTVQVPTVNGLAGLQALLNRVQHNQALVHGIPQQNTTPGQTLQLVTAKHYRGKPGQIARTKKCFQYPDTKLLMLDVDPEPTAPYEAVQNPQDLIDRLTAVIPELAGMGWLATVSTSSAIRCKTTGAWLKPPSGMHVYFLACGDVDRFVKTLKVRLWLAGLGFCKLATPNRDTGVAAVLERAIVDMSVFSPERLDYVAGAQIPDNAPFNQDRPEPLLQPGSVVNLDSIPKPTPAERRDYCQCVAAAKRALQPEREHIIAERYRAESPTADTATVKRHVKQKLAQAEAGELEPDHTLYMADGRVVAFGDLTEADDNAPLYDPLEGKSYHRGAYYHWNNGHPFIISLAHGIKTRYWLKVTPAYFCKQTVAEIQQNRPRLVAIRASHGTGKTQRVIRPIVAGVRNVLAITHRRALATDTANNINVENYQNIADSDDAAARGDRLIICINSLIKLKYQTAAALNVPDVLVLDEVEQLLEHLKNAHGFKKDAGAITDKFWQLVKSAKQVILADADLEPSTVAEFEKQLECSASWYRYEPPEPQLEIEFIEFAQGADMLRDAFEHDNVLIASDSLKALDEIEQLATRPQDILKITQHTTSTAAAKRFLAEPNAHLTEQRHLLYSPSMGSGVSIQTPHFTRHFAIYTGTITATEFIQLIRRDRTVRKITVLFRNIQKRLNLPTKLKDVINAIKVAYDIEYGDNGLQFSAFDDLRLKRTVKRNQVMRDPKASLQALCKRRGFTVTENTTAPHNKPLVTLLKQKHTESKRAAIQAAAPLDEFTAEAIERGMRGLTPELAIQLERWQITSTYRLPADAPIDIEIFERWDDGRGVKVVKFADNVFGSLDAVEVRSRHDAQLEASLCRFPKYQRLIGQQLLNLLRIDINTGWGGFNKDDALAAWQAMKACATQCQKAGIDVPKKQPKYPARWAAEQLAKMGLKTTSKRTRAQGRQRDYHIERESWEFVQALVKRRAGAEVVQMPPIYTKHRADVDHHEVVAA